ncbi:hypothetical protein [Bradyrhizobium sp. USDA 313]|uniref:hypothetical protein n=1 Tax=Bradyrhizobium sp. USDA 313 TaxID=3156307 RepID=UPI0035139F7F
MAAFKLALIQAHSKNVDRYERLLRTRLTDVERRYIESRLSEEKAALETIGLLQSDQSQRELGFVGPCATA